MHYVGKLLGVAIGLFVFHNPWLALLGLAIGHVFDSGLLRGVTRTGEPLGFIEPLFALIGAVAKADGRVSEAEIAIAERLMTRLNLDPLWRRRAIERFNAGKSPGYDPNLAIADLRAWCALRRSYAMPLIDMVADAALAEGPLSAGKLKLLRQLAWSLHIGEIQLMALLAMKGFAWSTTTGAGGYAHANASGNGWRPPPQRTHSGPDPYAVLGVPRDADQRTIKRAYRKLIGEHHPDRLTAAPEDLRRRAEQRASEINAAWERIQSERGFK
ncbi:MAG: co-chaperone DjlA [Rhodanobacteraceae bacterium]|nr:co-chaperone DjlA [Pseudomonadota bacterium]